MKIAVFGATGNTGQALLSVAVKQGHEITVLVRNLQKLSDDIKPKLASIIVGDVLDSVAVQQAVQKQDAIIVVLGTGNDLSPTTALSEGLKNVLQAMETADVKRISACLSGFLFFDQDRLPPRFRDLTDEHERMLLALQCSTRQWVAVCPPHIADEPGTGTYVVNVGKTPGRRIAKEDLADFLIACLLTDQYLYQAVGLGYGEGTGPASSH